MQSIFPCWRAGRWWAITMFSIIYRKQLQSLLWSKR